MSIKYHVGKNGPAVCKANKRACNLGQHYEDRGDANIACAMKLEKEDSNFSTISKNKNNNIDSTMTIDYLGNKKWRNSKEEFHRIDGPAIELSNGVKEWWQNGKRHRVDGPAIDYGNGNHAYYMNGKLHRSDGPAIEYANGNKEYWVNGQLYRADGPAVEYADGYKEYWVNGKIMSEEDFLKKFNAK